MTDPITISDFCMKHDACFAGRDWAFLALDEAIRALEVNP